MIGGSYARSGLPLAVPTASHNAANQQTGFGSQSLAYDLNGNLTSEGTNTYVWNARDQLVSMTGPGLTASFQYDAFGNRISKTVNGATVSYLYDGANLVQEQSGGSPSANVLAGTLDEIFIRTDAGGAWSPLVDGLGSTLALTDSTGTVQTQYTYEPFGKTTTSGSSNGNPSQYTGRENDGTGLYYYRARYYSPSLQRFISEDPIGLLGGINLYGYVGNHPVIYRDPFGLKPNSDSEQQREDIDKMLRAIVDAGKNNLENVLLVAGLEGGGAVAAERVTLRGLSQQIAEHAFEKHILTRGEYPGYIRTTSQFREFVERVLMNPTEVNSIGGGRVAVWDESTGSVLIYNSGLPSRSTVFQPTTGYKYFKKL